jgi:hypothetical protein
MIEDELQVVVHDLLGQLKERRTSGPRPKAANGSGEHCKFARNSDPLRGRFRVQ